MSDAFWSDPPWANGNGGHQMLVKPLAESGWCPKQITAVEKKAKQHLLENNFSTVVQTVGDSGDAQHLLAQAIGHRHALANTSALNLPADISRSKAIIASALTVPEDLCLMRLERDSYRLVAACVCAPSYWLLPEKIGLTLRQIHQPVPGLDQALAERMSEFFTRLPANRVFTRRNWLLHTSNERFQPVDEHLPKLHTADEARQLIMRSETQTLRRLSAEVVVFTINIECYPLTDICTYPSAATALKQALLSRSAEEREAAGQDKYHRGVIELLDSVRVQP